MIQIPDTEARANRAIFPQGPNGKDAESPGLKRIAQRIVM
jgi:hypothetical protein